MEKDTKQQEKNNEIEIDLGALFMELVHHWFRIVLSVVLMALVFGLGAMLLITPQYKSTSILYVLSRSTSITSYTDIQIGTNLTNDYVQVVTGRPVLDQVSSNLGLDLSYGEMKSKVSVNNPSDTRMLEITVEDPVPENAKIIADEIAAVSSAYIAQKMDQDPPEIIQSGNVNSSRSSPSYRRYTAIGAVIGLVVAVAFVWIIYLANDTIMTPEDMERKVGLQVLGSLPLEEAELNEPVSRRSRKHTKRKGSKNHGK
ncbi:MAG: capsular biosynthesis protein [Clostridiales bacterium]|nr:capsular biosynthesis protein [Clostridiales bacterium]